MKKILSLGLVVLMLLSVVGCDNTNDVTEGTTPNTPVEDTVDTNNTGDAGSAETEPAETTPVTEEANTIGDKINSVFSTKMTENNQTASIDLANAIIEAQIVPYMMGAVPLSDMAAPDEEGKVYLQGFDNYDFAGVNLADSAVFMPMMGSVPFIGYIFDTADEAELGNLMVTLKENANMRWQVCVEADQMIIENSGDKILFVMCPSTIEEQPEG